jgi:hypothetical protein
MWRHVDIVLSDVSEESIASIFRVEDKKKSASEPALAGATDLVKSSKPNCIRGSFPFLILYSWVYSTGLSLLHLLTLVP